MTRSVIFFILCALVIGCLALPGSAVSAQTAQKIQQQSLKAMIKEKAVQEKVDQWQAEKQALIGQLLDQKTQVEWYRFQNRKFESYLSHKKETIAELERQKEQMSMLRRELAPFLDQILVSLRSDVEADLPFLPEERQNRLSFVADSLDDPDLSLGEKLRRVLEALQVEADYGNTVEVAEETLELDGQPTLVNVLRLGRLGLFYLNQDGSRVGRWSAPNGAWLSMDGSAAEMVRTTMDVILQKRTAVLIDLPLPPVEPAATPGVKEVQ